MVPWTCAPPNAFFCRQSRKRLATRARSFEAGIDGDIWISVLGVYLRVLLQQKKKKKDSYAMRLK